LVAVNFRVRFFLEFELLAGIGEGHRRGRVGQSDLFYLNFCYHIRLLNLRLGMLFAFVHDTSVKKYDFGLCLQGYGVVLINTDEAGTLLVTNFRILFLV